MTSSMTRNAQALAVAMVVAATGVWGCGTEPSGITESPAPIMGGTNDTTHTFAVGIVVQIGRNTALCSGALLAPNLVATARHCVAAISGNGSVTCGSTTFGTLTPATGFTVTTDPDIRSASATGYPVSQVVVPTGSNQTGVCGNDIALLILKSNISLPAYVTPVLSPPMTDHSVYSTTVTAIGYGVTSASDTTGNSAGTRRIKQNINLQCISGDKTFQDCLPQLQGQVTASEFVSDPGTCEGDSGSSAYEQDNFDAGRWVSFGVLSRGGDYGSMCGSAVYTRFDAWASLIIDTAKQAAMMGGYTVPVWANGDGGVVTSDGGSDAGGATDAGAPRDASSGDASADASRDGAATDGSADGPRDGAAGMSGSGGRDAGAPPSSDAGPLSLDAGSPSNGGAGGSAAAGGSGGAAHPVGGGAGGQGGSNVGESGPVEGGCSCDTAGGQTPGSVLFIAAALIALARRRRQFATAVSCSTVRKSR
jgi:MYXO-CTERM domain-containing protein